ncbi:O-antigen ligase [Alkalispirillum mobile]|uniref:O-antigen ligase n=1 Tax=Alkalispirillum mobile TaxID=85925 RepID=A0A498C3G1_9GAMM|nr:O-antigen ligase family protein [Alkalispirillum mobile]RLK46991.1 O-antigen ligase [Alkalispirillum mobile]
MNRTTTTQALKAELAWFTKANYFALVLIFFLAGFFVFEDRGHHRNLYYLLSFLPIAYLVITKRIPGAFNHKLPWVIVACFLGFTAASALWSSVSLADDAYDMIRYFLLVMSFLLLIVTVICDSHWTVERILLYSVLLVAAIAFATLLIHYQNNPFPYSRVPALSRHGEVQTLGANMYGVFATASLVLLLQPSTRRSLAPAYLTALAVSASILLAFLVLAQTRGAILALAVTLTTLLALHRSWKTLVCIALALVLVTVSVELWGSIRGFLERGAGARPAIWADAWRQVLEAPWFGQGRTAEFELDTGSRIYGHPHNVVLYLLLQTGFVGLSLWLICTTYFLLAAYRIGARSRNWLLLSLMVFGLIAMLFTSRDFLRSPNTTWLLYWLPVGLIIGAQINRAMTARANRRVGALQNTGE